MMSAAAAAFPVVSAARIAHATRRLHFTTSPHVTAAQLTAIELTFEQFHGKARRLWERVKSRLAE